MEFMILGSGMGKRFSDEGIKIPKPFIPLHGKPFYRHVIDNYQLPVERTTLVIRETHAGYAPADVRTKFTPITQGPAETLLRALSVQTTGPLVVLDCDCWLTINAPELVGSWLQDPYTQNASAIVLRTPHQSVHGHFTVPVSVPNQNPGLTSPLYNFTKGSTHVNPGFYYFSSSQVAKDIMEAYLRTRPHEEPTLVQSLVFARFNRDYRVEVAEVDAPFTCVGTPEEYEEQQCTR